MFSEVIKLLGLIPRRDEALLVQEIDKALLAYTAENKIPYLSYAPESNQQNFARLNKYCGDLVTSFGAISALILEVKVRKRTGTLSAYDEEQHEGLNYLFSKNVPVYFAFNMSALTDYKRNASHNLNITAAVAPPNLEEVLSDKVAASSLKSLVDDLIKEPPSGPNISCVLAAILNEHEADLNSGIAHLSTEKLLIAYDHQNNSLSLLTKTEIVAVLRNVYDQEFAAKNKSTDELRKAIAQMQKHLSKVVERHRSMSMGM
ncbi:MAG: hypothetical protein NTZ15_21905 [Burkholderiales bacterium]|nr:hypothetical protein [Burkholderiales bacterium]